MNSLKLLFCISSILISNLLLSQDCTINTYYEQHSCSSFTFFEENEIELQWTVNDEFHQSGWWIDFDPSEAGTYEICGYYETVDCPQGPFACDTIVVSEDCIEDCEFNVEINQQSCAAYNLFTTGQEIVDWYVNDVFQSTGTGYDFDPNASGTYEICAVNEGCPPATNFCETFIITEDCVEDCEFNVEINQQSCAAYNLFTMGQEIVDWYVNDVFQSTGTGYNFDPNASGTYEICVVNEGCPPSTNFCETFVIAEDCFEIVNVDETLQDQEIIIRPTITKSDFYNDGLSGNCIIEIVNQNGTLVYQTITNGNLEANYDISNLLPGLYYILILNSKNNHRRIRKVLKI